jgi:hypothetical protein
MKLKIIYSTDNKHLGVVFEDTFPILLADYEFSPDYKIAIGLNSFRYFNSNYSIDTIENK